MKSAAYILQFVSHNNLDVNDGDLSNLTDGQEIYSLESSNRRYKGKSSGEAPLQYLIDKAWRDMGDTSPEDRKITILPIVSFALYSGISQNSGRRLYEIFLENIPLYLKNLNIPSGAVETKPVFYDFKIEKGKAQKFDSPYSSTNAINKGIFEHIVSSDPGVKKHVLIDYTGGLRDTSYLITLISQYLSFFEIPLTKIVYSNFNNKNIYSITYLNRISELIRSINSFNQSGNPEQLINFFQNEKIIQNTDIASTEQNEYQKVLLALNDIDGFFSCICINDMTNIDNRKTKLEKSMNEIRKLKTSKNIYISLFCNLFDRIRNQFFLDGKTTISYSSLIKWCINHNQINQAVTLFVEKMPQTYLGHSLLSKLTNPNRINNRNCGDPKAQDFYGIYDNITNKYITTVPPEELTSRQLVERLYIQLSGLTKQFKEDPAATDECNRGDLLFQKYENLFSSEYPQSKEVQSFLTELRSILAEDYDENGRKNKGYSFNSKKLEEFVKENRDSFSKMKTSEGLLNLISRKKDLINMLLFGGPYVEFESPSDRQKKTYLRKMEAVEQLLIKNDIISSDYKRLSTAEILRYYLIMKIIRNRMNHAVDYENPTSEQKEMQEIEDTVIEKCTGGFGMLPKLEFSRFDLRDIKAILKQAVSLPIPQ